MFKKIFTKLIFGAAALSMAVSVAALSACNMQSKHPAVRITVQFEEEDYELDYTLYRNLYPNTVQHFIELAENKFYDGMLVHNYTSTDWFTGGFDYVKEEYEQAVAVNAVTEYLENHSKEGRYMELFNSGALTPTVYGAFRYDDKQNQVLVAEDALPTLIGEFENNIRQKIENGALEEGFGTLKMYYYAKESTNKVYVTPTKDGNVMANYKTNCATSLFAMQTGSSSTVSEDNYCVFGRMENTDKLTELLDAINNADTSGGISANGVTVENEVENFSTEAADKAMEKDFSLPAKVLVIKEVKVTKY